MKLSEFKSRLEALPNLRFALPSGREVPAHFHVTELGRVTRHFVDCGGTERMENKVNFQLWVADDREHRLSAEKLLGIIAMGERQLGLGDWDVEIEYQGETIGRYGLGFKAGVFQLLPSQTACLALDACGVVDLAAAVAKPKVVLSSLGGTKSGCSPGGGCC